MKPASFRYVRPNSVAEVCEVLAAEPDARIIAGGQTLTPMLAMRLARPSVLVDIHRIGELIGISRVDGAVVIRSATRQVDALHSAIIDEDLPLLAKALPWVGHPPTRTRGTVGGSIANADPSAEIGLVAVTLDAEIVLADGEDEEVVLAEDFFIGPMLTVASPSACLTEVRFPRRPDGRLGVGFQEISSRKSDFAFASAAAQLVLDADGACSELRVGVGGVGDVPLKLDAEALCGTRLADAEIRDFAVAAMADVETVGDLHASEAYRRRAGAALIAKAIIEARQGALNTGSSGGRNVG
ncbi:FAD binding domain-containing protein [Arsenicitalea aurantiaca]|nr:FAD binding domain-containing protein [Arsenicitalea aurantiaca]